MISRSRVRLGGARPIDGRGSQNAATRAAPRGPSPGASNTGEVIAVRCSNTSELIAEAVDVHDLLIVPVAFQQLLAERKEGGAWQAIILQENALLDVVEDPVDATCHAFSQTEVGF